MRLSGRAVTHLLAEQTHVGANPTSDFMATETKTIEEQVERTITIYKCDNCDGEHHDEIRNEELLNKVVFGADVHRGYNMPANTTDAHSNSLTFGASTDDIIGDYNYLLCNKCMEEAHDHFSDFF
jgi:hypothetical protein